MVVSVIQQPRGRSVDRERVQGREKSRKIRRIREFLISRRTYHNFLFCVFVLIMFFTWDNNCCWFLGRNWNHIPFREGSRWRGLDYKNNILDLINLVYIPLLDLLFLKAVLVLYNVVQFSSMSIYKSDLLFCYLHLHRYYHYYRFLFLY